MAIIKLSYNQLNRLFEYRNEPRLPFDDDFYGKKNQFEHYLDWLEEFGKYGTIGSGSLDIHDCIEGGVRSAMEHGLIHNDNGSDIDDMVDVIANDLWVEKFKRIQFDNRGNIYVERAVMLGDDIDSVVNDLFSDLRDKYNGNVGGCWAFIKGRGISYCANSSKETKILLKGYIMLDDVDWMKTCALNYNHNEYEIRVNPNAKVELFEVLVNGSIRMPLKGTLVVSSTYFGNNVGYEGDLATVDDGMGNRKLMDRDGKILDTDVINGFKRLFGDYYVIKNKHGLCTIINGRGEQVIDSWYNEIGMVGNKFIYIDNLNSMDGRYNFIDINGNLLSPKIWFSGFEHFSDNLVKVQISEEENNLMDRNGRLLYDEWFYYIEDLGENGIAKIEKDESHVNYIRSDGSFLVDGWFDGGYSFRGDIAVVRRFKGDGNYDTESNFLNSDGRILYPNNWFRGIRIYNSGDFNKSYIVLFNGQKYYADRDGVVDFDHPFQD